MQGHVCMTRDALWLTPSAVLRGRHRSLPAMRRVGRGVVPLPRTPDSVPLLISRWSGWCCDGALTMQRGTSSLPHISAATDHYRLISVVMEHSRISSRWSITCAAMEHRRSSEPRGCCNGASSGDLTARTRRKALPLLAPTRRCCTELPVLRRRAALKHRRGRRCCMESSVLIQQAAMKHRHQAVGAARSHQCSDGGLQ
ncbi:hypothetical protein D1007_17048 [Hordeum vulgare]|nr:hypothetical protein D1007_17048 [Hordeum vulgare]